MTALFWHQSAKNLHIFDILVDQFVFLWYMFLFNNLQYNLKNSSAFAKITIIARTPPKKITLHIRLQTVSKPVIGYD